MLTVQFDSWNIACNFSFGQEEILRYLNSEKPRVPVEAFFVESNRFREATNVKNVNIHYLNPSVWK